MWAPDSTSQLRRGICQQRMRLRRASGLILGTLVLGTLALGTLAMGTLALGTLALGTLALGTLAMGSEQASLAGSIWDVLEPVQPPKAV